MNTFLRTSISDIQIFLKGESEFEFSPWKSWKKLVEETYRRSKKAATFHHLIFWTNFRMIHRL